MAGKALREGVEMEEWEVTLCGEYGVKGDGVRSVCVGVGYTFCSFGGTGCSDSGLSCSTEFRKSRANEPKEHGVVGKASRSSGVGEKWIALGSGDPESWRMNAIGGGDEGAVDPRYEQSVLMGGGAVRERWREGGGRSVAPPDSNDGSTKGLNKL